MNGADVRAWMGRAKPVWLVCLNEHRVGMVYGRATDLTRRPRLPEMINTPAGRFTDVPRLVITPAGRLEWSCVGCIRAGRPGFTVGSLDAALLWRLLAVREVTASTIGQRVPLSNAGFRDALAEFGQLDPDAVSRVRELAHALARLHKTRRAEVFTHATHYARFSSMALAAGDWERLNAQNLTPRDVERLAWLEAESIRSATHGYNRRNTT